MVNPKGANAWLPGTIFSAAMAAALIFVASPASAQPAVPRGPAQATSQAGVPNSLETAKLVWSIMVAVDQANRTGNYSVLRGLGGPAFQAAQTNDSLTRVFADLRARRIDVGNALLVTPTYEIGPLITSEGLLRIRGVFPLRPESIGFDLLFQRVGGEWRLFGIAVVGLAPTIPSRS